MLRPPGSTDESPSLRAIPKAERGHEAIRGIVDEVHRSVVFAGVADDPSPDDCDDLTGESLVTGSGDRISAVECGLADLDHVFADELEDKVWDSRIVTLQA